MADDLLPRPTHVQELIALHPREYALVSARMLAVASVVAVCSRCTLRSPRRRPWCAGRAAAVGRVPGPRRDGDPAAARLDPDLLAAPRCAPRGARRARRTAPADGSARPARQAEQQAAHLYNAWLLALLARLVWAFGRGWERSAFEQRVLRHVLACVTAQLATHIASACSVLLLIHRGDAGADSEQRERVERACPATLVDEALRRRLEERDSTCIVCFSELAVGDRVRSLPCGHTFHTECVDGWWRAPRGPMEAKCPTCSLSLPADDSRRTWARRSVWSGVGAGAATKAPGDLLAAR